MTFGVTQVFSQTSGGGSGLCSPGNVLIRGLLLYDLHSCTLPGKTDFTFTCMYT